MKANKRQVLVRVTEKHIKYGVRQDCYACPIALAMNEATGQEWHVSGRTARMELLTGGRKPIVVLSLKAYEFMSDFDFTGKAEPFEFTIPARFADRSRWIT